eukprot:148703_1
MTQIQNSNKKQQQYNTQSLPPKVIPAVMTDLGTDKKGETGVLKQQAKIPPVITYYGNETEGNDNVIETQTITKYDVTADGNTVGNDGNDDTDIIQQIDDETFGGNIDEEVIGDDDTEH